MIVSVASGKGGTGKTSVAVNIALSVGNVQFGRAERSSALAPEIA